MTWRNILIVMMSAVVLAACGANRPRTTTYSHGWIVGGSKGGVLIEKQRYSSGIRYRARNTNSHDVCVKVIAANIRGDAEFFGYDNYRLVKANSMLSFGKMFVKGSRAKWYIRYWVKKSYGKCSY